VYADFQLTDEIPSQSVDLAALAPDFPERGSRFSTALGGKSNGLAFQW
jgi:hypothetical protein